LKAAKLPSGPKNVECPECGHPFQVTPAGITAALPRPQVLAGPGSADTPVDHFPPVVKSSNWLAAGVIGSILVVGAGIIAAIVLTRTPPPEPRDPGEVIAKQPETQPSPETSADPADDKHRQEFIRLMIEGGTSLNAQRFEEAVSAYTQAVKLAPDDADLRQKLTEAQAGLAKQEQARKDEQKVRDDAARLIKQGKESLEQKKYAAAVDFFKLALQKVAGDSDAAAGLVAAQDGLNREQLDQKKFAEYENLIATGKAALKGGRFADAIRDFIAAQRLVPNDTIAAQLQREAEKHLEGINNRAERQKELQRLLDLANNAVRAKNFEEAEKTYQRILELFPNDPSAQQGLADSQKARKQAEVEFATWMLRGNAALQAGRIADAVLAFREATRVLPDNETASRALRQAESLQDGQQVYFRAMERAAAAMSLKQYGDAVIAYNEALRAFPGDLNALQGLQDAQRLFEADAGKRRDFDKRAFAGLQFLKAQKYSEAATELRAALRILPHHPQAVIVERQLRYAEAMSDGLQALAARRFQDAIREFQTALREFPNDFAARNALAKARAQAKTAS
jgi:tetratricopeptide (TPR) repeat protein